MTDAIRPFCSRCEDGADYFAHRDAVWAGDRVPIFGPAWDCEDCPRCDCGRRLAEHEQDELEGARQISDWRWETPNCTEEKEEY